MGTDDGGAWYDARVIERADIFLEKAEESLAGAESEYLNGRYNNCANRCYYAAFQAAIWALSQAGIRPSGRNGDWGHDFVISQFNGQLINRRKLYAADLRGALDQNYQLRIEADYSTDRVGDVRAARAVQRTKRFVDAMRERRERKS